MATDREASRESSLDLRPMFAPQAWDRVADAYADLLAEPFGRYADEAIAWADPVPGERVLDVATGPGTLALRVARTTEVDALDFSPGMLAALRARADEEQRRRLRLHEGDGQALPFTDASFDVAFSLFGLFLFPDRGKGFAEMARVLRPGGRAVIATWQPQDGIAAFAAVNAELAAEMEPVEGEPPKAPLSDPAELAAEMGAAGFDVEVRPSVHRLETPSLEALWSGLRDAHVALGLARSQLSEPRWEALQARIEARLRGSLDDGPQSIEMPAWLALGRRA